MTADLKYSVTSIDSLNKEIALRKAAEEKSADTAREWEVTFNSIPDLIAIYDKDYRIVKVNKAYSDFFKMKPEELAAVFGKVGVADVQIRPDGKAGEHQYLVILSGIVNVSL